MAEIDDALDRCRSSLTTSSQSIIGTVNASHKFTIQGYSLAKGMGVGKYIASDTFIVGGFEWAIYFYPDGKNPNNDNNNAVFVSVFITLVGDGTDVRAIFELSLLDQSGKGNHKIHTHFDRSLEDGPHNLKCRGSMWGYKKFFKRSFLEESDFLKGDCLVIDCRVGVVVSSIDSSRFWTIPVPETDIGLQFMKLLESNDGADVVFNVSGQRFQAHKLVLAARSPVFQTKFFGGMEEWGDDDDDSDENEILVDDFEPEVFKAMLVFIYSDHFTFTGKEENLFGSKLLALADKYGLDRLRMLCESFICKDITIDSVCYILSLADQYHAFNLKAVCFKFVDQNLLAVLQSTGFQYLKKTSLSLQSELLMNVAPLILLSDGDGDGDGDEAAVGNGRRIRRRLAENSAR
ncbi:BTB/POZ domain containing protein, expressed [Zostera marina]|uniref:BTB/POZ domain containing protein, expressed n=1 Tax=Zostera marina TaxID=29655 RepID=A0A0K9PN76_ZOSMR|nr:BTB/POZ domain containing protein, expressed [Zostera marina]